MSVTNTEISKLPHCTLQALGDDKRLYVRIKHVDSAVDAPVYQLVLTGLDAANFHAFLVKADG